LLQEREESLRGEIVRIGCSSRGISVKIYINADNEQVYKANDIHFADGEKKMTWLNCGTSYATSSGVVAFGSRNVSSYPRSINFVSLQHKNRWPVKRNNGKRTFKTAKERGKGLLLAVFVEHDKDAVARARLGIDEASKSDEDGCGEGA
jgi:hypothetical protein